MKIAFCFSGEVRTFDHPYVIEGFNKYIRPLGADCYWSVWGHRGISYYSKNFCLSDKQENIAGLEEKIREYYPVNKIEIEDYNEWFNSLNNDLSQFLTSYRALSSSAPQLYKIYRTNKLIREEYDIIIRIRPDMLMINSFDFSNFIKDKIFHMNFGTPGVYFKNRCYDICFYGSQENMNKMSEGWPNYISLIMNPFQNGLDKKDACRLLYVQAINHNLEFENMPKRIGDIYRNGTLEEFTNGLQSWGMTP